MPAFSEQKVLFTWETEFCEKLFPVLVDLGCKRIDRVERDGRDPELPHRFMFSYKHHDKRKRTEIVFESIAYVDREVVLGKTSQFPLPTEHDDGWRRKYAPMAIPIDETISRQVELLEEETSDYKFDASFEITNTTKVEAKGGIDGIGEASASSETTSTAKTSFGTSGGKKSVNKRQDSISTHLVVPVGQVVVATVDVDGIKEVTPFMEKAYIDAQLTLNLYDWVGKNARYVTNKWEKKNVINCEGIKDLLWFLEGQRVVEYPGMDDFLRTCSKKSRRFYNWLKDKENRLVELEGQKVRTYENSAEIRTRFEEE